MATLIGTVKDLSAALPLDNLNVNYATNHSIKSLSDTLIESISVNIAKAFSNNFGNKKNGSYGSNGYTSRRNENSANSTHNQSADQQGQRTWPTAEECKTRKLCAKRRDT